MHAHAHEGSLRGHVAPEDLEDADLRRNAPVGPRSRSSRARPCSPGPPLHWRDTRSGRTAACRAPAGSWASRTTTSRREPMLADRAAQRPGEHSRLQRRNTPVCSDETRSSPSHSGHHGRLVAVDSQAKDAVDNLVARGRGGPRAPLRQVVRQPASSIQGLSLEVVLEFEPVARPVQTHGRHVWHDSIVAGAAALAREDQALTATSVGFETWPSAAARARERSSVWTSARR